MGDQHELFEELPTTERQPLVFSQIKTPVWTANKAKFIAKYLYYFVLITKHGAYIDGFAAPKAPDLPDSWAAKLVLESEPKYLRDFFLCEIDPTRAQSLEALIAAQTPTKPKRHILMLIGDFNDRVHDVLASGRITDKKATFCLLDQYSFECHWSTLQALASHKAENKIELFYFLATGWLDRGLSGFSTNVHIPEAWWGRADWRSLQGMNQWDRAILFCDRFKDELGYRHATPWPIYEDGNTGKIMFHMIHATDHDAAPKIMYRAYRNATNAEEPFELLQSSLLDLWDKDENP